MSSAMIGKRFKIVDQGGLSWGTFVVSRETEYLGVYNIHGTLIPSKNYRLVKPVFSQHEIEIEEEGDIDDVGVDNILEFRPYLVDEESGEKVSIKRGLFITGDLLVTVGVSKLG